MLESLDISFNEYDPNLINFVFNECHKIEKVYLVNNLTENHDYNFNFIDTLDSKLKDLNKKPIKILEIKISKLSDINEIKNLLKKRSKNGLVVAKFISKEVIEFGIN